MSEPLVLVTGGAGFVGAALLAALSDAGRPARALEHRGRAPHASVRVRGDLRDAVSRARALEGVSSVFHAAALLDPVPSEREADEINHRATLALAREARDAGARTFVFVSTQAVLGSRTKGLLAEDAPCTPMTAYARTKHAAERALLDAELAPMRLVIVRPPTVYGPGERRNFLALTRAIATGLFPMLGRGENRTSFCHVENLVAALLFVEANEQASGIVHAADARPVTLRELVRSIAHAAGTRPLPLGVPLPAARALARGLELAFSPFGRRAPLDRARLATLTSDCALDTGKLERLGFRAPVGFDEGVRETVARYRAEGVL